MSSPSILIINPNSSKSVTENLKQILQPPSDVTYSFFTAPSGPAQVDSFTTEVESASVCINALEPLLSEHDGFLVGCYGDHPLIYLLRERTNKPVLGIFQATVLQSLAYGTGKFAVVTTAKRWEAALDEGVLALMGSHHNYAGTFSTGLGVLELHSAPPELVKERIVEATQKALAKDAKILILGCAGMSGMEEIVAEQAGEGIRILDAVVSGCELIVGMVRSDMHAKSK
jgi:Asp/Glu/hydantoin racemase